MFFFENYHKINEEFENLKKKMEVEQKIKLEMREQLDAFEQKIKELETMRNDAHKTSVARATQHSEEMRTIMEQMATSEEKVEKLEKHREELLTQLAKAAPPTPSLSNSSSRQSLNIEIPVGVTSFTKNSPHYLSRSSSVASTKSNLTPISAPSSPRFEDDLELEDYTDESELEQEVEDEEEDKEAVGDLMEYLSQLRTTLTHLSNDIIDEFDESSQLRQQHHNSMKQISEEKQELSKDKLALEWKMLLLKRRLHQQELDNEKTKGLDVAKAKEWDKLQRDKDGEVAELEEKIREERKDWEEEEEKSRRKITNLELDLDELRKDNVKLKEQVERSLVRRGHDTSDGIPVDGLKRSASDKAINSRIKNVEGRKRSNTQVL